MQVLSEQRDRLSVSQALPSQRLVYTRLEFLQMNGKSQRWVRDAGRENRLARIVLGDVNCVLEWGEVVPTRVSTYSQASGDVRLAATCRSRSWRLPYRMRTSRGWPSSSTPDHLDPPDQRGRARSSGRGDGESPQPNDAGATRDGPQMEVVRKPQNAAVVNCAAGHDDRVLHGEKRGRGHMPGARKAGLAEWIAEVSLANAARLGASSAWWGSCRSFVPPVRSEPSAFVVLVCRP